MKHTAATAFIANVLQFCWEFRENSCLFDQNARQEWASLDRSTDLGHCLFVILEVTEIGVILFKKTEQMGVE